MRVDITAWFHGDEENEPLTGSVRVYADNEQLFSYEFLMRNPTPENVKLFLSQTRTALFNFWQARGQKSRGKALLMDWHVELPLEYREAAEMVLNEPVVIIDDEVASKPTNAKELH